MGEKMTLEEVREWLAGKERMYVGYQTWATSLNEQEVRAFRAAIDAHLATPAQTVDVEARNKAYAFDAMLAAGRITPELAEESLKLSQAIGDKT